MPNRIRQSSRTWEDKWDAPDFDPWWQADVLPNEFVAALRKYVPNPDTRILDVGCGDGHLTCLISLMYKATVGVDIAPAAIARANANATRSNAPAKFKVVDISSGGFIADSFDLVIDRGCMHGMTDSDAAHVAGKIARCLGSGGYFLQMHLLGSRGTKITEKYLQALGPQFRLEYSTVTELHMGTKARAVGYFVCANKVAPPTETMT